MRTQQLSIVRIAFLVLLAAGGSSVPVSVRAEAQAAEAAEGSEWSFSIELYSYMVAKDTDYVQPTVTADYGALHLEGRHNYEDLETSSGWLGYNFTLAETETVEITLTPMVGVIFGDADGWAPGYRFYLGWERFEISSEGEYVYDDESSENDFFYNWSEVLYSPTENFWFGIAAQRTKLHDTDLDTERGITIGTNAAGFDLSVYVFNLGWTDPTWIVGLGREF